MWTHASVSSPPAASYPLPIADDVSWPLPLLLTGSLPIDSIQGMRKRTRAGMGGCQGKPWNYGCECRVAQIIERETKLGGTNLVGRRPWSATYALASSHSLD